MKAFIQGFCLALAWGGAIAATICTFLSLFAQQFWGFALLEHPRPQYILLILPIGMGTLITRRWAQCFWLIPLLINLAIIQPHIFSVWPTIQAAQAPPSLVFVHFNLDRDHPKFDKAIEYLIIL